MEFYTTTAKTWELLEKYRLTPTFGEPYKCFLTGEKVDFRNYRVFKIKTSHGLRSYRFYLNPMYHTMCRESIPFIEQKILRDESGNKK